jgi:outer membrane receptor protein involved in Fe transport
VNRAAYRLAALTALAVAFHYIPAANAAGTVHFDIPRGRARQTLDLFSAQAGVQLLFPYEAVRTIITNAVSGDLEPLEALRRLTDGTLLTVSVGSQGEIAISVSSAKLDVRPREPTPHQDGSDVLADRRSLGQHIEQVTIRSSMDDPSGVQHGAPMITLSRAEIDARGLATVQDAIRTLPQVFGNSPSEDTNQSGFEARTNLALGYGLNLRGLGAGSTLVLLNGRRLPGSGSEGIFVDVSNIPVAMIERIEILPDSSAAQYGADAVAGVVNFVLRDSLEGAESTVQFGTTTQGSMRELHASQIFGTERESFRAVAALDYHSRGNLPAAERRQAHSDLRAFGGDNFDTVQANPGTIIVGDQTWRIPRNQDGSRLAAYDLEPGANMEDRYEHADVLPQQQRFSVYASGTRYLLDDRVSLFADALFSQRNVEGSNPGQRVTVLVPPTNAFYINPSGDGRPTFVAYNFADDLGPMRTTAQVSTSHISAGMDLKNGDSWHVLATGGVGTERLRSSIDNLVDPYELLVALADPNPATSLNVYGDGSHTSRLTLDQLRSRSVFDANSRLATGNITVSGQVPSSKAAARPVSVAAGIEHREQAMLSFGGIAQYLPATRPDLKRAVNAVFALASIPVTEHLDVGLATRYDRYSDFGQRLSPRLSATWSPSEVLTMRAGWSQSYRPPNLFDLDERDNAVTLTPFADRSAPGGLAPVLVLSGNNMALKEESAENWTLGLDLRPRALPSLALAVSYFDINFRDRMNVPTATEDLLTNEALANLVTLDPTAQQREAVCKRARTAAPVDVCRTGHIAAIADLRVRNSARLRTNGIDLSAKYEHNTAVGTVTLGVDGTYVLSFAVADSRAERLVEQVSTQNNPIDLRLRGSAGWKAGGLEAHLYLNYFDNYRDVANIPHRRVSAWTTTDLVLMYAPRSLSELTVNLGCSNLFDLNPPFLNNQIGIGYDQENAELTGRVVSLQLRKTW